MLKHFEHVGMATGDLEACLHFYVDLMGLKLVLRKSSPGGRGEVVFLDAGGAMLDMIVLWRPGRLNGQVALLIWGLCRETRHTHTTA